ncbi:hypothetical protein GKE82_26045 [Conexibacter sp. W3-3-2]|uniref:hypothetical protein n=1 Tax=Conexibacter sp. W3-3-2 TaxID=2675227 RepID=UPI0012B7B449|nr:hypothetical protein [Conexibacter sp. W3-3-2]MTD47667.1 hypothetical protein [Conexibacter sp. W3-3-2]
MTRLEIAVVLDGHEHTATTTIAHTSPHTVALETVLADAPIELHSTYLGHPRQSTHATHLYLPDETSARTITAVHRHDEIPVCAARQRCLLDHYGVLVDQARTAGAELRVLVHDENLAAIDTLT